MAPVIELLERIIGRITRFETHRNDHEAMQLFSLLTTTVTLLTRLEADSLSLDQFAVSLSRISEAVTEFSMTRKDKVLRACTKGLYYVRRMLLVVLLLKVALKMVYYPVMSGRVGLALLEAICEPWDTWVFVLVTTFWLSLKIVRSTFFPQDSRILATMARLTDLPSVAYLATCLYLLSLHALPAYSSLLGTLLMVGQFLTLAVSESLCQKYLMTPMIDELGYLKMVGMQQTVYGSYAKVRAVGVLIWAALLWEGAGKLAYSVALIAFPLESMLQHLRLRSRHSQRSLLTAQRILFPPLRETVYYGLAYRLLSSGAGTGLLALELQVLYRYATELLVRRRKCRFVKGGAFCVICREEAYWVAQLPCRHSFHPTCWQNVGSRCCPVCRQPLSWGQLLLGR